MKGKTMKNLEAYKLALINEIKTNKEKVINMGFDWPTEELKYDIIPLDTLEEYYAEIMGYIALHNFIDKNYPNNE